MPSKPRERGGGGASTYPCFVAVMSSLRNGGQTMDIATGFATSTGPGCTTRSPVTDALVFGHGYSLDRRMWDGQFEHSRRATGPCATTCAASAVGCPHGGAFSHHDDLRRLFDLLGIQRAHVCGLSSGAGVTLDFALEYPERVLSAIGVGSALGGSGGGVGSMTASVAAMVTAAGRGDLAEARRVWLGSRLFAPASRNPGVARRLREMVDDWSGWQLTNRANHVDLDPAAAHRLGRLAVRALVIVGELDNEVTRRVAVEIEARVPNARRVDVPDAGHMANMEAPKAVSELIAAFIAEQGAGPARP